MIRNFFKIKKSWGVDQNGFTIIETMISVALFLVVMMTGMDALLNANVIHQKSQDMRSILDNMSFIMEDISRNIRTGSNYRCINDNDFSVSAVNTPLSGAACGAVAFESDLGDPSNTGDQWVYKVEGASGVFNIFKSTNSGAAGSWVQLNPSEVVMDQISGFSVLGAEIASAGDTQQPFVIIRLSGKITLKNSSVSNFALQTSVSQRLVDVIPTSPPMVYDPSWTLCTPEGSGNFCTFSGVGTVAFGNPSRNLFNYYPNTNGSPGLECYYVVIGDPDPGQPKNCYYKLN